MPRFGLSMGDSEFGMASTNVGSPHHFAARRILLQSG